MKKSIGLAAAFLAASFILTSCSGSGKTSGVEFKGTGAEIPKYEIEQLELPQSEGLEFVKDMKLGWNLGNTMDAETKTSDEYQGETAWGAPMTTEEMILAVKEAGFNTVRLPVTWHTHVDEDFNISEVWLNRVQEVVDFAYDNGMYVILNIHHDIVKKYYYPTYETLENTKKYSKAIWTQVSEKFKDYDEHLIFESINEPRLKGTDNEWWIDTSTDLGKEAIDCIMQVNQEFVDLVRASGGKNETRYLMTPSYCASPVYATDDLFSIPNDPAGRTIVSVHAYEPYNFALDANKDANKFDDSRMGRTLEILMKGLYDKFTSKGIPVVIGEFGSRNKNDNTEARISHAGYYTAAARAAGITCVWWDNNAFTGSGELFGLFDRKAMSWKYPDIVLALVNNCE